MMRAGTRAAAALLLAAVLFASARSAQGDPRWQGRPLSDALRELQAEGLKILFSSDFVTPEMRVRAEPRSAAPREILDEILAPWGLVAMPGPAGSLLVTHMRKTVAAPAYGRALGHVRGQGAASPIERAEVVVVGTRVSASTGSDGAFSTKLLPAGTYVLEASAAGFLPARVEDVRVGGGETTRLDFDLAPVPVAREEVAVAPSLVQIRRSQPESTQLLTRREVDRAPHIGDDPFRVVSQLPGTTPGDISARFHIRGGEQDGLLVLYGGQELYNPYHFKDFYDIFSILDPRAIGDIDFSSGGFPVQYGSRLSGVLDLTPNPSSRVRRSSIGIGLLNANVFSEGAFAAERGHWLFSGRLGYLRYVMSASDKKEFDPKYYDAYARGQYRVSESTSLYGNLLVAGDDIGLHSTVKVEDLDTSTRDTYAWLGADSVVGSRLFAQTIVSGDRLTRDRRGRFEDDAVTGNVRDLREFRFAGGSQAWTAQLSESNEARFGIAAKRESASYDYDSTRRITISTNLPPLLDRHIELDPGGSDVSAWASDRFRPASSLTVELGLRWDHQNWAGSGDWSPRANVVWSLGKSTALRAAWGLFTQPQRLDELQVEDGQIAFSEPERAEHRILGVDQTLPDGWSVRLEGYHKKVDRVRSRFESLFSKLDLFPELKLDRTRVAPDRVDAKGVELLVKREGPGPFSWFASYTRATATDVIGGERYPTSWDQGHSINLNLNYRAGERWNFGASWVWHSGWPFTGVRAELHPAPDGGQVLSLVGRYNSDRLPPYHRLDLRISHEFPLGRGNIQAYLEITNLYNRKNPCCINDFNVRLVDGQPHVTRIYDTWLLALPSFGIQWSF